MNLKKAEVYYSHNQGGWPDGIKFEIDVNIALNIRVGEVLHIPRNKNNWIGASISDKDFEFLSGKSFKINTRVFFDDYFQLQIEY